MLTPKELSEKKFDKVMFGGYDMGAVDSFLGDVEADYSQLYKENATLKKSMKVLVAKVEEYRGMDDSMRKALASAQSMAAQIIDKAKVEALNIENAARARGNELLSSYAEQLAAEEMKLEEAKTNVQMFVERMLTMYAQATATLQAVRETELNMDTLVAGAARPAAAPAPVAAVVPPVREVYREPEAPAPVPEEEVRVYEPVVKAPAAAAPVAAPVAAAPAKEPEAVRAFSEDFDIPEPDDAEQDAEVPAAAKPAEVKPASAVPERLTGIDDEGDEPEFIVPIAEPKIIRRAAAIPPTEKLNTAPAIPPTVKINPAAERTAPVYEAPRSTPGRASAKVVPDTVKLPYVPPVPQDTDRIARQAQRPAQDAGRNVRVYEKDLSPNEEYPNSVRRVKDGDDDGETIILTPKPRFEFGDLQFGEKYDTGKTKKK